MKMDSDFKIFLAGHKGLVGSAVLRKLQDAGYGNILTRDRSKLELRDQREVDEFFKGEKPEAVILAAAKVGGILANNTFPADFIRDNLLIQTNVIDSARKQGVERFIFLGSSCIYPKLAPQPLEEEYLLSGYLEPTNDAYAVAKIAGIKMCQAYHRQHGFEAMCLMPTNLYGPGDNFDLSSSHVIPALINKFHAAKKTGASEVTIWGTGKPRREFLHVDDMAAACVYLLSYPFSDFHAKAPDLMMNVGSGEDIRIADLAGMIKKISGFEGDLTFDTSKPDGTPRKLMGVKRILSTDWRPKISLEDGLSSTFAWFNEHSTE